jgi:hypothetical protein
VLKKKHETSNNQNIPLNYTVADGHLQLDQVDQDIDLPFHVSHTFLAAATPHPLPVLLFSSKKAKYTKKFINQTVGWVNFLFE